MFLQYWVMILVQIVFVIFDFLIEGVEEQRGGKGWGGVRGQGKAGDEEEKEENNMGKKSRIYIN